MNAVLLPTGPGSPALTEYLVEEGRELLAWTSDPVLSLASIGNEMEALASMNTRLNDEPERAILHYTLSWPPHERPDADGILEVARKSVAALGFDELRHHVLIVVHDDTPSHIHAHIVICRVRLGDHRLVNPRLPMVTLDRFCRQMEIEHGWSHSPGLHAVEDRGSGPEIIRRRVRSAQRERPTAHARDGELQTGLPSFQRWLRSEPYGALRTLLSDLDTTQDDVHATLASLNLALRHHKRGLVIVDRDDGRLRAKASSLALGLDYRTFTMRFGEVHSPDTLPPPTTRYRDRVRDIAPDDLRDQYERERAAWLSTPAGAEVRARRDAIRTWASQERTRLRRERDKSVRAAKRTEDPFEAESLAMLMYEISKTQLEQEIIARRLELRAFERLAGKPAATFFKWKRQQQYGGSGTSQPGTNEIFGKRRYTNMPPEIPGFTHTLGPSGRDYYRDRLRVMVLKGDRVTVLSRSPQDIATAARLAREVYGSDLSASGDERFVAAVQRYGIDIAPAPQRPTLRR